MKKRAWVPNLLTMGNLLGGVVACWWAANGPSWAPWERERMEMDSGHTVWRAFLEAEGMWWVAGVWVLAVLMDVFDGWAARKLGVAGPMGVQLDSLADVVTSGVVPAVIGVTMLHAWAPALPGIVKWLPLTMAAAAAYRLARFNVRAGEKRLGFEGVPAPAGALWWLGVWLLAAHYSAFGGPGIYGLGGVMWVMLGVLIGSTLVPWAMVSERPMMDLKGWSKSPSYDRSRKSFALAAVPLFAVGTIFGGAWPLGLLAVLLLYGLWSVFGARFWSKSQRK